MAISVIDRAREDAKLPTVFGGVLDALETGIDAKDRCADTLPESRRLHFHEYVGSAPTNDSTLKRS